jgi:hypothetical protein
VDPGETESNAASPGARSRTPARDVATPDDPTREIPTSHALRGLHTGGDGSGGAPFAYSSPAVGPASEPASVPPALDPRPAPPPTRTDPRDVCSSCGYGLAGLAITDLCPECRWPVVRSLGGLSLAAVPPERVAALRVSLLIIVVAQFVEIASVFGHVAYGVVVGAAAAFNATLPVPATAGMGFEVVVECVGILTSGATLLALWSLTRPDAAVPEGSPADRARRLLRCVACAALPLALLSSIAALFMLLGSPAAGAFASVIVDATDVLGYIFIAVVMSASGWFYATLAARMPVHAETPPAPRSTPPLAHPPVTPTAPVARPSRKPWTLAREARLLTWMSWVLLFPGLLTCFLGPITAVIWYLLLTIRLRAALGTLAGDRSGVRFGVRFGVTSGADAPEAVRSDDYA